MSVPRLPVNLVTIRQVDAPRFQIAGIAYRPEKHFRKGFAHVDFSNYRTVVIECKYDDLDGRLQNFFELSKEKDEKSGAKYAFTTERIVLGEDDDGDEISSLVITSPVDLSAIAAEADVTTLSDSALDAKDDEFIWNWVFEQVSAGQFPSKNSLKSQLNSMKEKYPITQARVGASIERLLARRALKVEPKSGNGNPWIRAVSICTDEPGSLA